MNNKGQSGVVFIILIPVFLLILAFVFDNLMVIEENTRFKATTKTIITEMLTNSYSDYPKEIKKMYEKNKYETDSLEVKYDDGKLTVFNIHEYDSFFGRILGYKKYQSEVNFTGYVENGKVKIINNGDDNNG
jgi:hypothetical protein